MELRILGLAVIVGLVQLVWATAAARRQTDMTWAMGPRDQAAPLTGVAARLDRAYKNFMETFPLFATAVVAAYLGAKLGALTLWGSTLYVIARALYAPAYAAAIPMVRSLVWAVSMVGLVMVVVALFR
jgi:uncharacterized MAPEG superfamily protein